MVSTKDFCFFKRFEMKKKESHNSLQKLTGKDLKKANETITAMLTSQTMEEAAEKLGISRIGLFKRRERYGLDQIIEQHVETARMKLQDGSIKAAQKLVSLIDDKRYSLEASKEVLDRVGIGKVNNNPTNIQVNVNPILGGATANHVPSHNSDQQDS